MLEATRLAGREGFQSWTRLVAPAVIGVLVIAAFLVPQFTDRRDTLNLLFLVYLYVTLAQSWNILAGYAGQINLGHAAFFGVGALTTRGLWTDEGVPFLAAFLVGGLAAMVFAIVFGLVTFRLRGVYFAIGTLALAEALRITVANLLPNIESLPGPMIARYELEPRYYLALGLMVFTAITVWALPRTRVSLGILAVREDEGAAEASGVNPLIHKLIALALSSFFAGLAGGTFAFYHVSYYPSFTFSAVWTFDAVLATFIGGIGTVAGPIIGGSFFILVRERLAVSLVDVHQIFFGTLFILVVLLLPGGLVEGWNRLRRLATRIMR
ncbi:MAG TPA: branched-chain amino acid ABC transporter permease [Dehalococcoidia bacterium]|nr:branched-chain amino acid ABC transporter permease [Dehalococcoidia bacterium]